MSTSFSPSRPWTTCADNRSRASQRNQAAGHNASKSPIPLSTQCLSLELSIVNNYTLWWVNNAKVITYSDVFLTKLQTKCGLLLPHCQRIMTYRKKSYICWWTITHLSVVLVIYFISGHSNHHHHHHHHSRHARTVCSYRINFCQKLWKAMFCQDDQSPGGSDATRQTF